MARATGLRKGWSWSDARVPRGLGLLGLAVCAGLVTGCPGSAPPRDATRPPAAAAADAPPHGRWLRVQGAMTDGFAAEVIRRLRATYAEGLILESGGGSVHEGRKLGHYLRRHGKVTATDGLCASACIEVLAAGVARYITPAARLGVHPHALPDHLDRRDNHALLQLTQIAYLAEMGVDHRWTAPLTRRPRAAMIWLSPRDALTLRLATAVVPQLPASAAGPL